jgi:hypothetical protein
MSGQESDRPLPQPPPPAPEEDAEAANPRVILELEHRYESGHRGVDY